MKGPTIELPPEMPKPRFDKTRRQITSKEEEEEIKRRKQDPESWRDQE